MDTVEPNSRRTRRWWIGALASGVALAAALVSWYVVADHGSPKDSMTARAQHVMPFDLAATTHTFTKTDSGGVEKVVVNDPTDTRNRELIRSHLTMEAESFRRGDYSDPAQIHGMDMPGLKELEAGAARVKVAYVELPEGAQITYSSDEPTPVSAIHAWFDRQVADHGMPGMGG